jgi:hypothetical protein
VTISKLRLFQMLVVFSSFCPSPNVVGANLIRRSLLQGIQSPSSAAGCTTFPICIVYLSGRGDFAGARPFWIFNGWAVRFRNN